MKKVLLHTLLKINIAFCRGLENKKIEKCDLWINKLNKKFHLMYIYILGTYSVKVMIIKARNTWL